MQCLRRGRLWEVSPGQLSEARRRSTRHFCSSSIGQNCSQTGPHQSWSEPKAFREQSFWPQPPVALQISFSLLFLIPFYPEGSCTPALYSSWDLAKPWCNVRLETYSPDKNNRQTKLGPVRFKGWCSPEKRVEETSSVWTDALGKLTGEGKIDGKSRFQLACAASSEPPGIYQALQYLQAGLCLAPVDYAFNGLS